MKKLLITLIFMTLIYNINGQTRLDIYVIGTSTAGSGSDVEIYDGFRKCIYEKSSYVRADPMTFTIGSIVKDYSIELNHTNYLKHTPAKIQIIDLPISELSKFDVIDINEFIRTKTRDEVWEWTLENRFKKIWVIDRNDFYKSDPSLPANDRMKLIETEITMGSLPPDKNHAPMEPMKYL